MAPKTNWHRCGKKLRHCHPVYCWASESNWAACLKSAVRLLTYNETNWLICLLVWDVWRRRSGVTAIFAAPPLGKHSLLSLITVLIHNSGHFGPFYRFGPFLLFWVQQRLRMPTRTQRAGRAAAAALTVPSSQRRRTDASDDWDEEWNFHVHRWRGLPLRTDWLSESAGSQLSPAACEKSWRTLEYKAPSSSIGANFLQLSLCGPLWVFCGPLRYLVIPQPYSSGFQTFLTTDPYSPQA